MLKCKRSKCMSKGFYRHSTLTIKHIVFYIFLNHQVRKELLLLGAKYLIPTERTNGDCSCCATVL